MCREKRRLLLATSTFTNETMMQVAKKNKTNDAAAAYSGSCNSGAGHASSPMKPKSLLQAMTKTFFPAFHKKKQSAMISDDDETDEPGDSSEEEDDPDLLKVMHAKYATPQDQDVAVFLQVSQKLSLESMLFLLQGHARAMNMSELEAEQQQKQLLTGMEHMETKLAEKIQQTQNAPESEKKIIVKQFRFAEVDDNKVQAVVHTYTYVPDDDVEDQVMDTSILETSAMDTTAANAKVNASNAADDTVISIRPTASDKELIWWSLDDLRHFRSEAIETVHYFKRYRPDYIQLIETVAACSSACSKALVEGTAAADTSADSAKSSCASPTTSSPTQPSSSPSSSSPSSSQQQSPLEQLQEQLLQNAMKRLVQDSFARGLEIHICSQLGRRRKETVQAVLEEQQECWASNDSYDTTSHCLREQSLAYSQWSSKFAEKMAQCDPIDALQASLSRWEQVLA